MARNLRTRGAGCLRGAMRRSDFCFSNGPVLFTVCAANRRASLAGAKPVRQGVAPAGSNWSGDGSNDIAEAFDGKDRESDSANRQAVTRVNVEQASKKTMRKPTGHSDREGRRRGDQARSGHGRT